MRYGIRMLTLLGALAVAGPGLAEETAGPSAYTALAYLNIAQVLSSAQPAGAARPGRLSYLESRGPCSAGSGCSRRLDAAAGLDQVLLRRDVIDALHLVTYGAMDLKFTGKRLKLKVRF